MNQKGLALTLAIITAVLVTALAAAALSFGYNQRILTKTAVGGRTLAFYYAKAGLVDAQELLRTDPSGDFGDPTYDPPPYTLDVNGDGASDVTVDISARDGTTNLRTIQTTGSY